MKKIFVTFIACVSILSAHAQQNDTLQFMTDYRHFIANVEQYPQFTKSVADSLGTIQRTFVRRYRAVKPQLNDAQVGEYNYLKGRYAKKMLAYHGNNISNDLQAAGDTIAKATSRARKAVGGYFKGIFKKKN